MDDLLTSLGVIQDNEENIVNQVIDAHNHSQTQIEEQAKNGLKKTEGRLLMDTVAQSIIENVSLEHENEDEEIIDDSLWKKKKTKLLDSQLMRKDLIEKRNLQNEKLEKKKKMKEKLNEILISSANKRKEGMRELQRSLQGREDDEIYDEDDIEDVDREEEIIQTNMKRKAAQNLIQSRKKRQNISVKNELSSSSPSLPIRSSRRSSSKPVNYCEIASDNEEDVDEDEEYDPNSKQNIREAEEAEAEDVEAAEDDGAIILDDEDYEITSPNYVTSSQLISSSSSTNNIQDDWDEIFYRNRLLRLSEEEKKVILTHYDAVFLKKTWELLFDYQQYACEWFFNLFKEGLGGILADEMGKFVIFFFI